MKNGGARDGWMRELYEIKLEILGLSTGNKSVLTRNEFASFLESLSRKKSPLARLASLFPGR